MQPAVAVARVWTSPCIQCWCN